jgi:hypothetical protein
MMMMMPFICSYRNKNEECESESNPKPGIGFPNPNQAPQMSLKEV